MATQFQKSVWEALRQIPRGKVSTYSELAKHLGKTKAYRAVGTAVGKNPDAPSTPCHRVLPASGKIGNYSGPGGIATKIKLLTDEGLSTKSGALINFKDNLYRFKGSKPTHQ
jgi:methylated-DNA-[protein]-cysteine S-methyltransferase